MDKGIKETHSFNQFFKLLKKKLNQLELQNELCWQVSIEEPFFNFLVACTNNVEKNCSASFWVA